MTHKTVLISGGSGLVGKRLKEMLLVNGYKVKILSRSASNPESGIYHWNVENGEMDVKALHETDYIVHLAGENIGEHRWTTKRKEEIINSRVKSAELILREVKNGSWNPDAFISASGVGFYGINSSGKVFSESDRQGNGFLAKTCDLWENAANKFENLGVRTVKIRTGVVLSQSGGALSKMLKPVKLGFGAALGNGKQFIPWIHIDDLCHIYIKAIEDEKMQGIYNAVAPEFISNKDFMKSLAKVLNKPFFLPNIPSFLMKIFLGEMASLVLDGQKVSSEKIEREGYQFLFSDVKSAMENLLKK